MSDLHTASSERRNGMPLPEALVMPVVWAVCQQASRNFNHE